MKTIRIWHGCLVLGVVTISDDDDFAVTFDCPELREADMEIDPFSGAIVGHGQLRPKISFQGVDGE